MIVEPLFKARVVSGVRRGEPEELLRSRHRPVQREVPLADHLLCHDVEVTSGCLPLGLDPPVQRLVEVAPEGFAIDREGFAL